MGTIDVLFEVCALLSEKPNVIRVNKIIASIINRQKANGDYNYITIEGFPTVGLFYGLGGIAYTFLRLYEKGIIPNIFMMQQ